MPPTNATRFRRTLLGAQALATAGPARAQTNITAVLEAEVVTLTGLVQSSTPVFWSVDKAQ